jgi:hypothetical protein
MKNPIFIEYYPHENCDCYKILNPWTECHAHKIVLCPVSEGIDKAKYLAIVVINQKLQEALKEIEYD